METSLVRLAWSVIGEGHIATEKPFSMGECISNVIYEIENRMPLSSQERQQVQQYLSQREQLIQTLIYE